MRCEAQGGITGWVLHGEAKRGEGPRLEGHPGAITVIEFIGNNEIMLSRGHPNALPRGAIVRRFESQAVLADRYLAFPDVRDVDRLLGRKFHAAPPERREGDSLAKDRPAHPPVVVEAQRVEKRQISIWRAEVEGAVDPRGGESTQRVVVRLLAETRGRVMMQRAVTCRKALEATLGKHDPLGDHAQAQ